LAEELVHETDIPGLFILTSGSAWPDLSPLLYSSRMPEFFARCRSEFTAILIDAPPVLSVPDARILGRSADSVILVFRADSTTRDQAAIALRTFEEDGTPILGTILNDWNPNNAGYGSYRSYRSYGYYDRES
jgi:Mrp family chromosome partitioning ATPase